MLQCAAVFVAEAEAEAVCAAVGCSVCCIGLLAPKMLRAVYRQVRCSISQFATVCVAVRVAVAY